MRDHVALTPPRLAQPDARHRAVQRVQVKSSSDRERRRLVRRLDLNEPQARERIPDKFAQRTNLPFVQLRSTSTGQSFMLFSWCPSAFTAE